MSLNLKKIELSWVEHTISKFKDKSKVVTFEGFAEEFGIFNDKTQKNIKDYIESLEDKDLNDMIDYIERYEKVHNKVRNQIFMVDHYQKNVKEFYKINPFFYDKSKIFWMWDNEKYCYEIVDEVDLMNLIDKELTLHGQTITSGVKNNYLEAFKRVGREKLPKDAPVKWIQFKDKAFSIKSKKIYDVQPNYFFTNPIPWEIGKTTETPFMDELIISWVGEEYLKTMYEIIAYCCYRDYPIQLLFSFCGSGRNGKSQYLKIIDKFLGEHNVTSTELDLIMANRFETFKLYKKLACNIGETNIGIMDSSSILKKLTGGDKIGFEKKNKDPFDDYNYAKPLISSNSLPSSKDTSDGFYRRWLIINFPNEFPETGKDIINDIPEEEYNNLAKKITEILPDLIKRGKFSNQGTIQERKMRYIENSNPLKIWLEKECKVSEEFFCSYKKAYTIYINFLTKNKKRKVTMKEFKSALEDEGIYVEKTTKKVKNEFVNGYFIIGMDLNYDSYDNYDHVSTQFSYMKFNSKVSHNCHNSHKNNFFRGEAQMCLNFPQEIKVHLVYKNVYFYDFPQETKVFYDKMFLEDKVISTGNKGKNLENLENQFITYHSLGIKNIPSETLEKYFDENLIKKALERGLIHEPKSGFYELLQ